MLARSLGCCQAAGSGAAPSSPSPQSKELKGLYREQYSELQMVKAEADYTQKLVEQCMQELVQDFQDWYGQWHALKHADWQMCSHKIISDAHC